jgi:hypothetical protein
LVSLFFFLLLLLQAGFSAWGRSWEMWEVTWT